jgi:hypothetical protein
VFGYRARELFRAQIPFELNSISLPVLLSGHYGFAGLLSLEPAHKNARLEVQPD